MAGRNKSLDTDSIKNIIGVVLRSTQNKALKCFAKVVDANLAHGRYTVLKLIGLNPGCTQSALARASGLDRSSMVPIIDEFERRGWIARLKVKGDRRAYAVHLLSPGEKELVKLDGLVSSLERKIRSRLGKKKADSLIKLLEELSIAFDEIPASNKKQ